MIARFKFQEHMDTCKHCENTPHDPCPHGAHLLMEAARQQRLRMMKVSDRVRVAKEKGYDE